MAARWSLPLFLKELRPQTLPHGLSESQAVTLKARRPLQAIKPTPARCPYSVLHRPYRPCLEPSRPYPTSIITTRLLRTRSSPNEQKPEPKEQKNEEYRDEEAPDEEPHKAEPQLVVVRNSVGEITKYTVVVTCTLVTAFGLYASNTDPTSPTSTRNSPSSSIFSPRSSQQPSQLPSSFPFSLPSSFSSSSPTSSTSPLTFLSNNFAISLKNWDASRYHTLFSAALLHNGPLHLFFNMFVTWSFVPALLSLYGPAPGLTIMLLSSLGCSFTSLYWKALGRARAPTSSLLPEEFPGNRDVYGDPERERRHRRWLRGATLLGRAPEVGKGKGQESERWRGNSCGFSGVLMGVVAAVSIRAPSLPVTALFFVRMRLGSLVAATAVISWAALDWGGVFDHAGHLGGLMGGAVGWLIFRNAGMGRRAMAFVR